MHDGQPWKLPQFAIIHEENGYGYGYLENREGLH